MGAFDKKDEMTISHKPGWDAHEYIKIKGVLTIGDQQAVISGWMDGNSKKDARINLSNDRIALLHRMITEWHLTGNGQPIPLSKENITNLPPTYADPVLEAIDEVTQRGQLADPLASSSAAKQHS